MGATAADHPDDPILRAYGLGKLDGVSSVSVSRHLEACDSCRQRVVELSSDEFLGRLQQAKVMPDKATSEWSPSAGSSAEGNSGPFVPPPRADTLPPELVDHPDYEIVRELGRGGMGVVYLANNRLMERPEALKVVGRHLIDRPGVVDRFLREIRSAAKLKHANIVAAYTALRLSDSLVLAMEYVEGRDLAQMVKSQGPLPVANACYVIHQAALGLQHAHERGMVHRDIKPANLIFARDGRKAIVKVLDFGLAKVTSEGKTESGLTREGQMLGTPDYIAPEQIRDAKSADIRADIYSLGGTLYHLLTGHPPFQADSLIDMDNAHMSRDAELLNFVRPEVPAELASLVAKMLAKGPARRFQKPAEVAQALVPFFKKLSVGSVEEKSQVYQVGQPDAKTTAPSAGSLPIQPAPSLAPAPSPSVKKQTGAARAEPKWESLIAFKDAEPSRQPAPAVVAPPRQRPPWMRPAFAAASLFGFIALGVIIITIRDKNGVTTITAPDDDAFKIEKGGVIVENIPAPGRGSSTSPGIAPETPRADRTSPSTGTASRDSRESHSATLPERPPVPPAANSASYFDGRTRVYVARPEAFDMTNRDYTIFARIKTRRGGTIFSRTAEGQWVLGGKALFIRDGLLGFDVGCIATVVTRRQIDDELWHNVAMTYTHEEGRIRLFIDDKPDDQGTRTLAPTKDAPDHIVRIGYAAPNFPGIQGYFHGWISEVCFYQRALSIEEIRSLARKVPGEDSAVARWTFNVPRGVAIPDDTGHGHDGSSPTPVTAAQLARMVPGRWRHSRIMRSAASDSIGMPVENTFKPDGRIVSDGRKDGSWTLVGSTLNLTWQNPRAPTGASPDVCEISADGTQYEGRNEVGECCWGVKLSD